MKRGIAAFFRYARARHQIYLDRVAGKPRPWTKDEILQKYRFTNVFRELDKTTQWFARNVRYPLRETEEVLLATVVFRLLNRIEVGEAIWSQTDVEYESAWAQFLETGKVAALRRAIVANCGSGPYVTGAYIISSPKGYSKLDGMMRVIDDFNRKSGWREMATGMIEHDGWTLEEAWDWLKEHDYFGPFHSYEIVTDLRHTALLRDAPDIMTWANPGPGARRGLNRVHGRDKSDHSKSRDQMIAEMRELLVLACTEELWPTHGADGPVGTVDWPRWEMREVEHTLCEFDKFERVRLGEGRPRGVYR